MASFEALLAEFFYRPDEEAAFGLDLPTAGLPRAMAQVAPPREFLGFTLEGEHYAVPVALVREIQKVPALTELPRSAPNLLGVMSVRGEVVPVYDLKLGLGLATGPRPVSPSARVIVLRGGEGSAAILVDRVLEVVRLAPSEIEQPPSGVGRPHDGVVGLARHGSRLFILLDVEQALA